jgi:23S rRNA (guanosine2251-2'-O)-methyltransferase
VYLTGYTPSPATAVHINESSYGRYLPHIQEKMTNAIKKVALGAEDLLDIFYTEDAQGLLTKLKSESYKLYGLEQTPDSTPLSGYNRSDERIVLLLGEEVGGIPNDLLGLLDGTLEIAMHGKKESFNVSVACGIALYEFRRT